jgi:hypothetical protein
MSKYIVAVGETAILVADSKKEARRIATSYRDNGRFATIWPTVRTGRSWITSPLKVYESARAQGLI